MNWKTLGKAFLHTIAVMLFALIIIVLIRISPIWLLLSILFLFVWAATYLGLEKQKNYGNDNDRMSWNYDNEEDDYLDNDSNDEEEDEK